MDISISKRIAELGFALPRVAKPLAAYVPAIKVGEDQIWTSGQLPMLQGTPLYTGKLGGTVTQHQGVECARQAALNAIAAAGAVAGSADYLTRVLKVTVYVASENGFTAQPKVADGASELFAMVFGGDGQHVRSAVGVAELPLGVPVEVEVVFGYVRPDDADEGYAKPSVK